MFFRDDYQNNYTIGDRPAFDLENTGVMHMDISIDGGKEYKVSKVYI